MISAVSPNVPFNARTHCITLEFGDTFSSFAHTCRSSSSGHGHGQEEIFYISKENQFVKDRTCALYSKVGSRWKAECFGNVAHDFSRKLKGREFSNFLFINDIKLRLNKLSGGNPNGTNHQLSGGNPSGNHDNSIQAHEHEHEHQDQDQHQHQHQHQHQNEHQHEGPPLVQLISDYLTHLTSLAHLSLLTKHKNSLWTSCNSSSDLDTLDPLSIQYILSHPQNYTHAQKRILRAAAFEGGIITLIDCDRLVLVGQEEATMMGVEREISGYETNVPASNNQQTATPISIAANDIITLFSCNETETVITTFKVFSGPSYHPIGTTIIPFGSHTIETELETRFRLHIGQDVYEKWSQRVPGFLGGLRKVFANVSRGNIGVRGETCKTIRILDEKIVVFTNSEAKEIITDVTREIFLGVERHLMEYKLDTKNFNDRFPTLHISREPHKTRLKGMMHLGTRPNKITAHASRYSYGTQFSKLYDPKTDDPTLYRWGTPPTQFIASFLPFTSAGTPIPPEKIFEQIVCPANDHQTEFPFGLYYSPHPTPTLSQCTELITLIVGIPEQWRYLGRENRFRILMRFGVTQVGFSVVHNQSGEVYESIVVL